MRNKNSYDKYLLYGRILRLFFINKCHSLRSVFCSKFFILEINTKFHGYRELSTFYPIKNTNKGEIQWN